MRPAESAVRWAERHILEGRAAATVRALAAEPAVHFEAGRPWNGSRVLPDAAPHLQQQDGLEDLAAYRGLADALAQRLLHSDNELHARLSPRDDPVAGLIFEWLEQWRSESLMPDRWPGMQRNLRARFTRWSGLFEGSGLVETGSGRLLLCFSQMAWSRLFGMPVPDRIRDVIAPTWRALAPELGPGLSQLRRLRRDQPAFARTARELASEMAGRFRNLRLLQSGAGAPRRHTDFRIVLRALTTADGDGGAAYAPDARSPVLDGRYAVWSRRHDQVIAASALVRPALLREYRRRLDEALAAGVWSRGALARSVCRELEQPQIQGWQFNQEEGWVDGRRLAQLVSSPDDHAIFYRERTAPVVRAQVCLLVDCSGSMKRYRVQLAMLMDLLGRAFERAEVPFELLGFTTGAWNGGRVAQAWARGGRSPVHPGRLSELQHLVFQSFDMPRQRGRLGLTAVMKPELFREGIDGEAVQWACGRLLAHPGGGRKILWVVSDGGPMDSATELANPPGFLDGHLRRVVREARNNQIEVLGIGVGRDLSAHYPHTLSLDLDRGLDMHALLTLTASLRRQRSGTTNDSLARPALHPARARQPRTGVA